MAQDTLPQTDTRRFSNVIRKMPMSLIHKLAKTFEVDLAFGLTDRLRITEIFLDEMSIDDLRSILAQYGDAGKASSFFFVSNEKIPSNETLLERSSEFFSVPPDSEAWENHPYFDEARVHIPTNTFRVWFHYLKGVIPFYDEEARRISEHRLVHHGVLVYRPDHSLLEVRTRYKGMASKVVNRAAVYLRLEPFFSVNMLRKGYVKSFIDWINSLNNARFEMPFSDATESIMITAREGVDLRNLKRFHDELKRGKLRGGHVTIIRNETYQIRFNVYFRGCHLSFTSYSSEQDIEFVADALEKITEGYRFVTPERLLEEFLRG